MKNHLIAMPSLDMIGRHCVDSAVNQSIARFADQLGGNLELTQMIATAAAQTALEQFRAIANSELRIIQIDWEHRAEMVNLKMPSMILKATGESK